MFDDYDVHLRFLLHLLHDHLNQHDQSGHNREEEFNMRGCIEAANHIVLMFIDYDVHLHIFIFVFISFMITFFNREEEFNMRACPEAANHSRYLAWDMQVLEELTFL